MTLNRTLYNQYNQAIKCLALEISHMANIRVKTVDSMQGRQAKYIIFNIIISKHLGFMQLKNRVNVVCFRTMDGMVIFTDVRAILYDSHLRCKHIGNVFIYFMKHQWRKKVINTAPNWYLSGSLMHGNISAIGSVSQNESDFVVNKDLELVSEEKRVELVKENFEATREMENNNKWDGTYEANAYTAWN